ncbi:translocation protein TolB precursor [mine drainage metagenome]|uniref:Translocation protein TolB n=1 Tax=mine drainage metagenome TaxID=410659 RepID=T1ART7_9ZZZZ
MNQLIAALRRLTWVVLILTLVGSRAASASLRIQITRGIRVATPIAIIPFAWEVPGPKNVAVANVIAHDLSRTGLFKALPRHDLIQHPTRPGQINFLNWKALGMDYLVIGHIQPRQKGPGWMLVFHLYNVPAENQILAYAVPTDPKQLRLTAHYVSDLIFQNLTDQQAPFTSRIAYVVESRARGLRHRYRLMVADYDGHHAEAVFRSGHPIVSPSFSPRGNRIAYVSFESGFPAIYVQNLKTGQRRRVLARAGLNETPVFTPGGHGLLVTVSGSGGSAEIGRLDLQNGSLRMLTHAPGINTEPAWFPGGRRMAFTSDRGGTAEIYVKHLHSGRTHRLTFKGHYNAAPAISLTGAFIAYVARRDGLLRIARMNLKTGLIRILTRGPLDDSPSFAPGGALILFSAWQRGRRILETASTRGHAIWPVRIPLGPADSVTTPVWGPDLPGTPH